MNASDKVRRLCDLLRQENQALRQVDYCAAASLVLQKEALLGSTPEFANTQPSLLIELSELARDNEALLKEAITAQNEMIKIILRAISSPRAMVSYSQDGGRIAVGRSTA